jgi:hypothetical protein
MELSITLALLAALGPLTALAMTPPQCPKISRSALLRVRGMDNWLTASLRSGPRQVDIGQTREESWTVLTNPEGK